MLQQEGPLIVYQSVYRIAGQTRFLCLVMNSISLPFFSCHLLTSSDLSFISFCRKNQNRTPFAHEFHFVAPQTQSPCRLVLFYLFLVPTYILYLVLVNQLDHFPYVLSLSITSLRRWFRIYVVFWHVGY